MIMSSASKDSFILAFPICISLISFSYLITVTRTSSMMLKRGGEREHPCFVPDFSGKVLNFSPVSILLVVGFLQIYFIPLRKHTSLCSFLKDFIMKAFIKYFFCTYWCDDVIFLLSLLMWWINWFLDADSSLHVWDKSNLVVLYIFFLTLLDLIF